MASENEFKIKGAAKQSPQSSEIVSGKQDAVAASESPEGLPSETQTTAEAEEQAADTADAPEEAPAKANPQSGHKAVAEQSAESSAKYKWCKCFYEPEEPGAQKFYFLHTNTQQSSWDEPNEPYWIWDAANGCYHASGLQTPSTKQGPPGVEASSIGNPSSEQDPNYYGYNPKIHGSYDPNAPYAQYHNRKRQEEQVYSGQPDPSSLAHAAEYTVAGTFNRFSGAFQPGDKTAEHHNDANKSGRQLNAFFDVDAAANAHDGRSLKEERRSQKLSKKEIAELAKKRREKKEKKRMDFYKS